MEKPSDADDLFSAAPAASIQRADMFDWSAGGELSKKVDDDDEFKIEFSDSDDSSDSEVFGTEKNDLTIVESNNEVDVTSQKDEAKEKDNENSNKLVDMFAQQIKFLSCLKILIQEMSTLATGFEVIGGQLRYFLYYWLERETHILRKLGDYEYKQEDLGELIFSRKDEELSSSEESHLHEQVLEDQKTFQAKIQRMNRRKEWLRSNELLLRTFISYCSLHNAKGGKS